MEAIFWIFAIIMIIVALFTIGYIIHLIGLIHDHERKFEMVKKDLTQIYNFLYQKYPETDPKKNKSKLYGNGQFKE